MKIVNPCESKEYIYKKEFILEHLFDILSSKRNMSKRLWTETRQVGAKNSTQKSNKIKAKLSHAHRWERFDQGMS